MIGRVLTRKAIGKFFLFLLTLIWLFAGWPVVWQNPRVPLEVQKAKAASGDVILLWDTANGSIPSDWTCISCNPGEAFYGVFPRAAASYGSSTAGSDTHNNHTVTYSSYITGASAGAGETTSNKCDPYDHTHTWGVPTLGDGDVRPPFKNLNFIYKNNPAALPANIIAVFDGSLPSGWSRYTALDSNYLRGYSDNATGGSATHSHTTTAVTSGGSTATLTDSGNVQSLTKNHTHTIAASSLNNANNAPQYLEVVFAYNSSGGDTSLPTGLIAMFDTTPPTNWSSVSGASPWLNSFLKGSAAYGGTGGSSADHDHDGSKTFTSGGPSATVANQGNTGSVAGAKNDHTHDVTYTISGAGSLPVYRDTIFAKYSAPTISVSISDGEVSYSIMPANTSKSTLAGELDDMQTATNDGNVTENFNIKGQDASGGGCTWTLASSNGNNQYVHQFCNDTDNDCSSPPTNYTALTTGYQALDTGIVTSGTVQFQLRLTTPTESSCFSQQSVDVTVQAVQ